MKDAGGYVPNTNFAIHDVEEELLDINEEIRFCCYESVSNSLRIVIR